MLAYQQLLNAAQYRVVSADNGPMLVVAGAGTGKTRTIVYRLAWLVEHGVAPWNILLLTFTRKAAREMLERASQLLNGDLRGLTGGTIHSFAYRVLRVHKPAWLGDHPFTVLDATDQQAIVKRCAAACGVSGKGFPKAQAVLGYLSKARNKEAELRDILAGEAPQLLGWADEMLAVSKAYMQYKRENFLLDYDDLLFELEDLLLLDKAVLTQLRDEYRHILVDEYQDTNMVQARIIKLLCGDIPPGDERSVMAVGDEAQSIYAFRGATVRNILDFPILFHGARVVPLEENYRSMQSVLDVANAVMSNAAESYGKHLTAVREGAAEVRAVYCRTDVEQGKCAANHIAHLLEDKKPSDIAVLFRVGYQSYQTEVELTALGIPYRKYGGLRYQEAAHVKDVLAYLQYLVNPGDGQAFQRLACMHDRIGPKTAEKIFKGLHDEAGRKKIAQRYPAVSEEAEKLALLRRPGLKLREILDGVMEIYEPHMEALYPEDYPHRLLGLQELWALAPAEGELDMFLADVQLDSVDKEDEEGEFVTLSTIHSAKGLEWDTVIVLDLVQGRFPSRWADFRQEAMEEERRLMYVACTRAKNNLELYTYSEGSGYGYTREYYSQSDFLKEVAGMTQIRHCVGTMDGTLRCASRGKPARGRGETVTKAVVQRAELSPGPADSAPAGASEDGVYVNALSHLQDIRAGRCRSCRHRIFGKGRIVGLQEPDKVIVDFPMLGRKIILASYIFVKS